MGLTHAHPTGEGVNNEPSRRPPISLGRSHLTGRCTVLLGEFGRSAYADPDIGQILQRATELCAQGLETSLAKVLEQIPDDRRLLVRAGVGWAPGTIGQVLSIDIRTPPAGYAFQTGQMVISNHLQEETRFRTPKLLSDHGIKRAINVLIARGGEEMCRSASSRSTAPTPASSMLRMLTSLPASLFSLGIAIERQRADADLKEALDHQAMLDARDEPPRQEQPGVGRGSAPRAGATRSWKMSEMP